MIIENSKYLEIVKGNGSKSSSSKYKIKHSIGPVLESALVLETVKVKSCNFHFKILKKLLLWFSVWHGHWYQISVAPMQFVMLHGTFCCVSNPACHIATFVTNMHIFWVLYSQNGVSNSIPSCLETLYVYYKMGETKLNKWEEIPWRSGTHMRNFRQSRFPLSKHTVGFIWLPIHLFFFF